MDNLGLCPKCGQKIVKKQKCHKCSNAECDFFIPNKILGKELSFKQKKDLINDGRTKVIRGFISKINNRPFDAILVLQDGRIEFKYIVSNYSRHKCPICDRILSIETSMAVCNQSMECNYILSKFCGKKFTVNQIEELLEGNVVEAYGFRSKSGKKFNAKIMLNKDKNNEKCGAIKIIEIF